MNPGNYLLLAILMVVIIVILLIKLSSYSVSDDECDDDDVKKTKQKEGFLLTSQNAYISPVTGAIKGPGIMTDGMTRMSFDDINKQVAETGFASDGSTSLGVGVGDGFAKVYDSQLEIQKIDDKSTNGYQSFEDLDQISRRIASNNNNSNNNMYTRAGSRPTKMIIENNGIRGVIDEKYLPDRDKNHQIATVQTVVPIQGYDINIERLGEYLTDTHFSKISRHGKSKRIPTAAGAVGGSGKMVKGDKAIADTEEVTSANQDAISQSIGITGNNIAIKDSVTGDTVLAPLDAKATETFRQTYIRGDSMR